jgi:predicted RND superfamily exporter protein
MRIMKDLVRVVRWVGELLVLLTALIAIAWAFGAV